MPVYVDNMHEIPEAETVRGTPMARMFADTNEELFDMVRTLRLPLRIIRETEQGPGWAHIRITAEKRLEAIDQGAISLDYYGLQEVIMRIRNERLGRDRVA